MEVTIKYDGSNISVSEDVAEFFETERKRQAAEERSDRRHTSKSESEPVSATAQQVAFEDPTWIEVDRILKYQKLKEIIAMLTPDESETIYLYFYEKYSMEQIAEKFGLSKMAISKRMKKLLSRMRELMET